jgi:hypothetical protein
MKRNLIAASTLLALLLSACGIPIAINIRTIVGSGNVKTEVRPVSSITAVTLSGAGELIIKQTGTESLTIEADDNLLSIIETRQSGDRLTIGFAPNTAPSRATRLRYTLTVRSLEDISLTGAGVIDAENIRADVFGVSSSGAGKITISGAAEKLNVALSGAGAFDGAAFTAKDVTVQVSGIGGATVHAQRTLNAAVSGIGSVEYAGNPDVTQEVSGIGQVKRK